MKLIIDKISKRYKDREVIKEYSTTFNKGVIGLLGANGAGKSTLMRMICGLISPSSGSIQYEQFDVSDENYRNIIGYLPQDFGYYPEFTGEEFLLYIASLKGINKMDAEKKVIELLNYVNLDHIKNIRIKTYSGGMKQRLGIAQALLNAPKIIVLDEPNAGLDPKERFRFRNLIHDLGKENIVIFSTHIVSDIEDIADRIIMMNKGNVIFDGPISDVDGNLEDFYLSYFEKSEDY